MEDGSLGAALILKEENESIDSNPTLPKKRRLKTFLLIGASIVIVALSLIPPESRARSQEFSQLVNIPKLTEQFTEDNRAGTPLIATRIFHNKLISSSLGFVSRYFSYFDPVFLFLQTTSGTERHSIPEIGLFFLIEAPLFLLGLLSLFLMLKKEEKFIPE